MDWIAHRPTVEPLVMMGNLPAEVLERSPKGHWVPRKGPACRHLLLSPRPLLAHRYLGGKKGEEAVN